MKFIHTSDWHIGQTLKSWERYDEHQHFFSCLSEIVEAEKPDALLVAGDVYDVPNPSPADMELFIKAGLMLHNACPEMKIIITAGNHDSGTRLHVNKPLWENFNLYLAGSCKRDGEGCFNPLDLIVDVCGKGFVIAAPYFYSKNFPMPRPGLKSDERQKAFFAALLSKVDELNAGNKPVVMMAHLAVEGTDLSCHNHGVIGGMKTESAEDLGSGFDYLALGHIHKPQTLREEGGAIRYSGSPFPMSFSEDFPHGVTIVEIDSHSSKPIIREIEISPLRKAATIKGKDGLFAQAIEMFQSWDADDDAYIRILVSAAERLPLNAKAQAEEIAKTKNVRFCYIEKEIDKTATAKGATPGKGLEIEELKTISPVDLAKRAFAEKHPDKEFPKEWEEMIQFACEEVNKKNEE